MFMYIYYIYYILYIYIYIYLYMQSAQISQKQDGPNIYPIMKTMCPSA